MFIEDQDEDVEEEEEFHEVEEEKHKTSQESVGGGSSSNPDATTTGNSRISASPKSSNKLSASSTSSKAPPSKSSATSAPPDQPNRTAIIGQEQDRDHGAQVEFSPVQASKNEPELSQAQESANVSSATSETISNLEEVSPDETSEVVSEQHVTAHEEVTSSSEPSTDEAASNMEIETQDTSKTTQPEATEIKDSVEIGASETTSAQILDHDDTSQLRSAESADSPGKLNEIATAMAGLAVNERCEADKPIESTCDKEQISDVISSDSRSQSAKNADWTDIMLSSSRQESNEPSETSPVAGENPGEIEGDVEKKVLDLDEDVKNPQYIPKKGVFYEHDDRSHDANVKKQPSTSAKKDEEATAVKEPINNKKANAQEKPNDNKRGGRRQRTEADRWNHDLFKDEKQKPKSKTELIYAYGYDIRHERSSRNQAESRTPRGNNNNANDRPAGSQENQRQRPRDERGRRTNQAANRSRERRTRNIRPNNRNRAETSGNQPRRDVPSAARPNKVDPKDVKVDTVVKQGFQTSQTQPVSTSHVAKRDYQHDGPRNNRNDNRGSRRHNSKDRPPANSVDDKLPPINTVMPPITTWSNKIEDMVKEEASRKESSPSRHQQQHNPQAMNSGTKVRSNDFWPQNQSTKNVYQDRPARNMDDSRQQHQQHYNQRRYHQDRDDAPKQAQYINRNQYNDRANQNHHEWRRTNHYNAYGKSNEYEPIKTQTFENSRLSQAANMNRSNFRDAREIINERRMQNQQNFQPKVQPGSEHQMHQRHQHPHAQQQHSPQTPLQHQQIVQHQQQIIQHQQMMQQQHQTSQHVRQQHQPQQQTQQQQTTSQHQQQQQTQSATHQPPQQPSQQLQNQRQPQPQPSTQQHTSQTHQNQSRQNLVGSNLTDGTQESGRMGVNNAASGDLMNSRPIIKSDAYTGSTVGTLSQPLQQHSQNHRSLGGQVTQQGPANSASSHLLPSHMGASGTQAQYYSPAGGSRDSAAAAAALATAYHGYMGGHTVMDATRYHMTQPLSDHGYMASPGQANDVAAASVLHQQGMYTDAASAGGTVASSAYLAQAGSTLSPTSNIPVTGAGPPPLPPVSYLQHSQYPPPYSNPYTQPQHNQAPPPQSSHAYPYWTYI